MSQLGDARAISRTTGETCPFVARLLQGNVRLALRLSSVASGLLVPLGVAYGLRRRRRPLTSMRMRREKSQRMKQPPMAKLNGPSSLTYSSLPNSRGRPAVPEAIDEA